MALLVAVCDDEKGICAALENALLNALEEMNIPCKIDVHFSGEDLCARMNNGVQYDLIFLDIEFAQNAVNGIEVGKLIRDVHKNNMVSIVYISWKMQYSMQLFDIRPLNFLIKPLDFEKVKSVVKTYLNVSVKWAQSLTYKAGHNNFKVPIKDIVYLESEKRKIIIHLADGSKEEFYGTLTEVYQEQLQDMDFLFIHTSYVVNYDYIKAVKYKEVILTTGGTSLPISRMKRAEMREAYCAIVDKRRV